MCFTCITNGRLVGFVLLLLLLVLLLLLLFSSGINHRFISVSLGPLIIILLFLYTCTLPLLKLLCNLRRKVPALILMIGPFLWIRVPSVLSLVVLVLALVVRLLLNQSCLYLLHVLLLLHAIVLSLGICVCWQGTYLSLLNLDGPVGCFCYLIFLWIWRLGLIDVSHYYYTCLSLPTNDGVGRWTVKS